MILKREGLMNLWSQWRPASAVSLIQRSISALHTALRLVHTGCAAMRARCCIYCEWTLCQVARPSIVDLEWICITLTTHSIYRLSKDHPLTAESTLMNDFGLEPMQTPLNYPPNYHSTACCQVTSGHPKQIHRLCLMISNISSLPEPHQTWINDFNRLLILIYMYSHKSFWLLLLRIPGI